MEVQDVEAVVATSSLGKIHEIRRHIGRQRRRVIVNVLNLPHTYIHRSPLLSFR
jgi:hypothetical protein